LDLSLEAYGEARFAFFGTSGGDPTNVFAEGAASFSNTLSFPRLGPAFNVPAGYTVNSSEAMIVDNRWIGNVPEPSSSMLVGIAATVLSFLRRGLKRT
jgi:hypothetical protein